jgi:hypothetical protein
VSTPTLTAAIVPQQDAQLTTEVLRHLDAQIFSARSLLSVVLEQGAAIRVRDAQTMVRLAGILRGEMGRRALLEEERGRLLSAASQRLGIAAETVTLEQLMTFMGSHEADLAAARSAELKGLLSQLQQEHGGNRALMQVELGFLDHLMGLLALDGVSGYDTHGSSTPITRARPNGRMHVLDLRA